MAISLLVSRLHRSCRSIASRPLLVRFSSNLPPPTTTSRRLRSLSNPASVKSPPNVNHENTHEKLIRALEIHASQNIKLIPLEEPKFEEIPCDEPISRDFLTPKEIRKHLDEYVIGQDAVKKNIAVALYNHYLRIQHNNRLERDRRIGKASAADEVVLDKSNIMLIGPSGSGKTLIAKTIAKILDVPFSMSDATSLTQAGYVGEDVEVVIFRLLQNANFDPILASRGIVFLDEVDKISRRVDPSNPQQRDVSGEGVQQGLLKMLEGDLVTVKPNTNKRAGGEQFVVDTTNILFVLSGAFVGLDRVVKDRLGKKGSIGFGATVKQSESELKEKENNWMSQIEPEDLVRYGLIPEFVGRVPVVAVSQPLDEKDLVRILTEPKNALVKQYQEVFQRFGVSLQFTGAALSAVASEARMKSVGARGLRRIIDSILTDAQYDLPGSNIKHCVVTADVVAKKRNLYMFTESSNVEIQQLIAAEGRGQVGVNVVPGVDEENTIVPAVEHDGLGDVRREATGHLAPQTKA